jgi:hypothetical protein
VPSHCVQAGSRRNFLGLAMAPLLAGANRAAGGPRPRIVKLGTYDLDMVEVTPVVWKGRLHYFEWVRSNYWANAGRKDYFRFLERGTGRVTPAFAERHQLGSAFLDDGTMYVTGVEKGGRPLVRMFTSRDLVRWDSWTALDLPGWGFFNTSIAKAADRYVMSLEIDKPKEEAGRPFTARFAVSKDLRKWELTPPECVFAKDRFTSPHCLRYLDGWYYNFYVEAINGYETYVVRSRDLVVWESSPLNPVLAASPEDRKIANPKLTRAQRERIATAVNVNASDIDFCEYRGRLRITYCWGNQRGIEHLAEATYDGTEASFLKSWFPSRGL